MSNVVHTGSTALAMQFAAVTADLAQARARIAELEGELEQARADADRVVDLAMDPMKEIAVLRAQLEKERDDLRAQLAAYEARCEEAWAARNALRAQLETATAEGEAMRAALGKWANYVFACSDTPSEAKLDRMRWIAEENTPSDTWIQSQSRALLAELAALRAVAEAARALLDPCDSIQCDTVVTSGHQGVEPHADDCRRCELIAALAALPSPESKRGGE